MVVSAIVVHRLALETISNDSCYKDKNNKHSTF